jgi:hypothetical protein
MGEAARTRTPDIEFFRDVFNASPIAIAVETQLAINLLDYTQNPPNRIPSVSKLADAVRKFESKLLHVVAGSTKTAAPGPVLVCVVCSCLIMAILAG